MQAPLKAHNIGKKLLKSKMYSAYNKLQKLY